MTYTPQDLENIRQEFRRITGLPAVSLGIQHFSPQGGGYHEGRDLLAAQDRAPGQPIFEYSVDESSRDFDGLTGAASAIDRGDWWGHINGREVSMRGLSAFLVDRMRANDLRARDLREVIYSPDGNEVKRYDRLGVRTTGDISHRTHGHDSFFRDSEGRRDLSDNYYGLIQEYFYGINRTTTEEEEMGASYPPMDIKVDGPTSLNICPVEAGVADPREAWLNVCNDTYGKQYALRVYYGTGDGRLYPLALQGAVKDEDREGVYLFSSGQRAYGRLPKNTSVISLQRVGIRTEAEYRDHLTCVVERGRLVPS